MNDEKQLLTNDPATQGRFLDGHLDGLDDDGRVLFKPEDHSESFPVAIGLTLGDSEIAKAAWLGRRALVVATDSESGRLILVGLVRERVSSTVRDAAPGELQVKVDGDVVRLEGKDRVELVCGKARLVLDSNGRVELNGSYVVHRSRGPMKIKGTTIDLN